MIVVETGTLLLGAIGAHLKNCRFRCVPVLSRSSLRQHALRSELRIGNGCRNRARWRVIGRSCVEYSLLPRLARRRGNLEGIESQVDWGRDRRSVVHPPATALEQLRARVGRFMPLRGACLIHARPTSSPGCCMTGGPQLTEGKAAWMNYPPVKPAKTGWLERTRL